MKRVQIILTVGFGLAVVCFLLFLLFRFGFNWEFQNKLVCGFLGLGGIFLLAASIGKMISDWKYREK